jgi:integrase
VALHLGAGHHRRPFRGHASLLLEKGVDIATVSERLGHSSVRTTADIYSHAIRGKDHAAAQTWDDIMQRARNKKSSGVN